MMKTLLLHLLVGILAVAHLNAIATAAPKESDQYIIDNCNGSPGFENSCKALFDGILNQIDKLNSNNKTENSEIILKLYQLDKKVALLIASKLEIASKSELPKKNKAIIEQEIKRFEKNTKDDIKSIDRIKIILNNTKELWGKNKRYF